MNERQLRTVVANLRQVIRPGHLHGIPDAELLERFLQRRDELAFEMLVWRHGAMVQNVCQRVLRDRHDAEDALQATFLIFVRKMQSIGKGEAVGSWLYKVAYRVALRARERSARWQTESVSDLNQLPGNSAVEDPAQLLAWRDLQPVLDEEVIRLPEKFRTPFVLYYFEGMGYQELAEELGCPKGTVSSRLTAAKGLLRKRLRRRGIGLPSALFGAALAHDGTREASAAVTIGLTHSTLAKTPLIESGKTAGAGHASAQAVALAEGVMKTMIMTKMKFAAAVVLAIGVLGFGASVAVRQAVHAAQPETAKTTNVKSPQVSDAKPAAEAASPNGITLGSPVPIQTEAGTPKLAPEKPEQLTHQQNRDPRTQNPNPTTPANADPAADRLARIEQRLARLEDEVALIKRNQPNATGRTGGNSGRNGIGKPITAAEDKPLAINDTRFQIPIEIADKEAAKLNKVELYISSDHGRKWRIAAVFYPERDQGGAAVRHGFKIDVSADGEYWFKVHKVYASGPTPDANFDAETTPDLKVVVDTKANKGGGAEMRVGDARRDRADLRDAQLADLTAQLKALQAKIAELKALQDQ